jgi:hypothetical protein
MMTRLVRSMTTAAEKFGGILAETGVKGVDVSWNGLSGTFVA